MDKWRGIFTYSSNGIVKIFYGNSKEECRKQACFWPLQTQETCRLYVAEEEYQKIDEMEPIESIIARVNETVL
jgi:adenylate kinase family enzyme